MLSILKTYTLRQETRALDAQQIFVFCRLSFFYNIIIAMALHVGDTFSNIALAKEAIKDFVANASESWKATYSDKQRFNIVCRTADICKFKIRAVDSKKKSVVITYLELYTCSPANHLTASNTNNLKFVIPHHRASIIDNPDITAKQIQSNKRLQFFNNILYF